MEARFFDEMCIAFIEMYMKSPVPNVCACGPLLTSKNDQGSLHPYYHKYEAIQNNEEAERNGQTNC